MKDLTDAERAGQALGDLELAQYEITRLRNRLARIEGAAEALLSRKDEGPSEDAHIFAEWDDLRDALDTEKEAGDAE